MMQITTDNMAGNKLKMKELLVRPVKRNNTHTIKSIELKVGNVSSHWFCFQLTCVCRKWSGIQVCFNFSWKKRCLFYVKYGVQVLHIFCTMFETKPTRTWFPAVLWLKANKNVFFFIHYPLSAVCCGHFIDCIWHAAFEIEHFDL